MSSVKVGMIPSAFTEFAAALISAALYGMTLCWEWQYIWWQGGRGADRIMCWHFCKG